MTVVVFAILAGAFAVSREPLMDAYRRWRLPYALADAEIRPLAGRLVGLRYAGAPVARRSGARATSESLPAHRARVMLESSRDPHLRAKAMVLRGQTDASIAQLRKAAAKGNAAALSDLSAALLEQALELGAHTLALDAIVEAKKAIAVSGNLPEAHFNLAMALDFIGLVNEAREEFRKAAALEPGTEWADEALRRAQPKAGLTPWALVQREYSAARNEATRKFVIRQNFQVARAMGESSVLQQWASLRTTKGRREASLYLDLLRTIGAVAAETHSDRFLADVAAVIDAAELRGEDAGRDAARTMLVYCDGRSAHAAREVNRAIKLLQAAARQFAAEGNPMQYAARYYIAGGHYEQSRIDQALQEIRALEEERLDQRGYRTLVAQLGWTRGVCLVVRGAYAEALREYDRSRAICVEIGDDVRAASFDELAAEALEYLGDSRGAWARRARALRDYASYGPSRTPTVLTAAANLQLAARNWSRAETLLDYVLRSPGDPRKIGSTFAFAQRAVARYELGKIEEAESDRGRAINRVAATEEALRPRLQAEVDIATSVAKRSTSAHAAIEYLTRSIAHLTSTGQSAPLPRLYGERARAYEALGDVPHRRADLRSGMQVVQQWEENTADLEQRAAISIWSEAMRRDLIALELAARDVGAAFSYADDRHTAANVRAPRHLRAIQQALAKDAAILEYVTTRERVVVFIIRGDSARATTLPASLTRIAAAVNVMRGADDEKLRAAASALHELLLAPILHHLSRVNTIAFVPDDELSGFPFGALRDNKRNAYLLERAAVVQAPSANAAIDLSLRARAITGDRMLAIGASEFDRERHPYAAPLSEVEKEAANVARLFGDSKPLLGSRATPEAVTRLLPDAALFHYGGHIVDRGADARFLLAPSQGRDSLSAREVGELELKKTRVAVLAACRGSGTSEATAIVQDMASGFLKAGVPTVIASSADVADDKAPRTMRQLHEFLRDGSDPAEALRKTVMQERAEGQAVPLSLRFLVMGGSRLLVR